MRPITPASRLRLAVVAPPKLNRQDMPQAGRRVVANAEVDASWSKSKMLKLRKAELVAACQEYGLEGVGNKEQLVHALRVHLGTSAPVDVPATTGANPEMSHVDATALGPADVETLRERVAELDVAIQTRTEELHTLHEGDRVVMSELVNELTELKASWQKQLQEVSAGLEDVVALKKSQVEVAKLHTQQEELQEELRVLSRMLKLRETEIQSLKTQFEQVRKERATEKESVQNERLAVLALASQVSMGDSSSSTGNVQQLRSMYAAPSYSSPAYIDMDNMSSSGGDLPPVSPLAALPRGLPTSFQAPKHTPEDVFGLAMPGLAMCGLALKAYDKFTRARDAVFESNEGRIATNAVTVVLASAFICNLV